ncbi:hypothetical protein FRX31_007456, partial [Thalictrum thalictroides]
MKSYMVKNYNLRKGGKLQRKDMYKARDLVSTSQVDGVNQEDGQNSNNKHLETNIAYKVDAHG